MPDKQCPPLEVSVPDLIPAIRVRVGSNSYPEPSPLHGLTQGMTEIYGLVGGIDHRGIEWLRWLAAQPQQPRGLIVLAVYAGSPTWDHVLMDALDIQQGSADRLRFHVIARRHGPDRPANLLWLRSNPSDPGTVVIGNVANLLVDTAWDDTDAVLVMPLTTVGTEAIRRWMDWTEMRSKPLTSETATAPRLALPEGTEEGRRLWQSYIALLDQSVADDEPVLSVDPETDEVIATDQAGERIETLTQSGKLRRADPVLVAVQAALKEGHVVSLEHVGQPPPFEAPIPPALFGEAKTEQTGSVRRQQNFRLSLFDDDITKKLRNRRDEPAHLLGRFSLSLQPGQRWIPKAALALLTKELDDAAKRGMEQLTGATPGRTPEEFVKSQRDKVSADCLAMLKKMGRDAPIDPAALNLVLDDLQRRLKANLAGGMRPALSLGVFQIADSDDPKLDPWGTIQKFLTSAASVTRKAMTNAFHFRGLGTPPQDFLRAFDLFRDPLVTLFIEGKRYREIAVRHLQVVDMIEEDSSATPWQRSQALWRLLRGATEAEVLASMKWDRANP